MGSASSREIRQIVDEAAAALLRAGQRNVMADDVLDVSGNSVVYEDDGDGDGGGVYYYGDDGSSSSGSEYDSESSSNSEEGCESCRGWVEECCFESLECCAGCCDLGKGRGKGLKERKRKEKKKKKKEKEKGGGFWARCHPVKGRDWGGDVVGITRCPGEQDPKRWGFKLGSSRADDAPEVFTRRADETVRRRHHHHRRHQSSRRGDDREACYRRDEYESHPSRRGRSRATLIFGQVEASPPPRERHHREHTPTRYHHHHRRRRRRRRGDSPSTYYRREDSPPRSYQHRREDSPPRSSYQRREDTPTRYYRSPRYDGDEEVLVMHGALGSDDDSDGGRHRRRRARSWERRSDGDDRVGEIDDRTEDSYALGERSVVVSRRGGGRRAVRFGRV
ncbi:hypothetical protein CMUS01_09588 [Colletotrichum musicola]|uniref:Uncharacterized protein n=1 Tax=Colletotrichum musicola TaxID=2175873 RepID=A0A8H6NA63_9PEZI|nr:hypothetical protein CMUS01_09588 [Colletotrichum musicola]